MESWRDDINKPMFWAIVISWSAFLIVCAYIMINGY
jgi:hypothetical protein